jgi:hypothetical protein
MCLRIKYEEEYSSPRKKYVLLSVAIACLSYHIAVKNLLWFGLLSVVQIALSVTIMINGEFGRVWKKIMVPYF